MTIAKKKVIEPGVAEAGEMFLSAIAKERGLAALKGKSKRELLEDLNDITIIRMSKNEPSRPFSEFVGDLRAKKRK